MTSENQPGITFAPPGPLQADLRAAVDAHFDASSVPRRGGPSLYGKAVVMVGWLVGSYVYLLLGASAWWQVVLGMLSLGLAMAGLGFNVQHDGNHGSFSGRRTVNRIAGSALDLMGGSSYYWRYQHNVLHHRYTNLAGADYDLDTGGAARLAASQPWRPVYRFQHLYLWALYGIAVLKWQWVGDYVQYGQRRMGPVPVPRPSRGDLVTFLGGKVLFAVLALGIPLLLHPWQVVVPAYVGAMVVLGVMTATIFSVAHSSDLAWHPASGPGDHVAEEWAVAQIRTTVGFAHGNRPLTWYLGGLNHQVEHHLFPRVAHPHYPAIAPLVRDVAQRYDVPYVALPTFRAAIASHHRFLRAMGRRPEVHEATPVATAAPAR